MKITRLACLSFLLVTAWQGSAAAAVLDLEGCIARGLRLNPEIASRKIAIEEANKETTKATSLFLPTLTASHQINSISNNGDLQNSREYPDQWGKTTTFRLSQPLFTGFTGLTTLEKVKYVQEYRQAELREARLALSREIQRQFFDYLRLLEDTETVKETIAGLEKQLKAATAFYEQRMAPQLQVLQAEVRLSSARQNLVQVETQVANARRKLDELLVVDAGEVADYSGRLIDFAYQNSTQITDFSRRAMARPDLHMADLNIALARKEAKLILARTLPRVSVDADYNDRNVDYTYEGNRDWAEDYWTLGVNMQMNLFQGGADIAAYRQQLLAVTRHQEDRRKLKNQREREVMVAYASAQEALTRIDSALKIKEVAQASLDRARAAFELGLGTTTTVLDAQQELTQAMVGVAKARTDFLLAKADLEYLAGDDPGYAPENIPSAEAVKPAE